MAYTLAMYAIIFLCLTTTLAMAATDEYYSIVTYGAKADGKTDSSKAFVAAWEIACGSAKPATIYVPNGKFYVSKVAFLGPCNNNAIQLRIDGTLVASSDYSSSLENWLIFEHVNGVTVSGGILDAQGTGLWNCKASGKTCPAGATSLEFTNSNNITISNLASVNSQKFHIVINECNNVKIQGVKISAAGNSPNTDGIHVAGSNSVTILSSKIGTGDDCISIGPATSNMWVQNVACGPGHGISIGSLGKVLEEDGVQNVTVTTSTFTGTQNGVRIKTWGRQSNSFVKNILFQHVVMVNVENPIIIDQNYCPDNNNCPGQESGVKISDVKYQDIHGSSATEVAVKLDCSKKYPCSGINLQDIKFTYKNQSAEASCNNAGGTASGYLQPASCL
ncbi:polygalacturonase-like [Euphorbia lathyris]|uniref:polygalacturonase-like n=1 Tax=Euphorbia lathyris TaxID=212925 RepID=UPI0033143CC8